MKIIVIATFFTISFFLFFSSCCRKKPATVLCPVNMMWDGTNCVCNKNSYWNGNQCVDLGTDISGLVNVLVSPSSNCNDWRDSIFLGKIPVKGTSSLIILQNIGKISSGNSAEISYTEELLDGSLRFEIAYAETNNHGTYQDRAFAMHGIVNKSKDTINARLYNAVSTPYQLLDYCDKIFVKVK